MGVEKTTHARAVAQEPNQVPAQKTCAIVEAYNRHDEVYLTTVYLLRRLGYQVHVFNTWRNRVKNSFVHAPGLKPSVTSRFKTRDILRTFEDGTFDLVVFNTLEGADVVAAAKRVIERTPILGFLHNASFVTAKDEYRDLVANRRCHLMTLAPYIGERFASVTPSGFMYPVYFNDVPLPTIAASPGRRRFCVQGYFDPTRRHYDVLLEAVNTLFKEGRQDFEVWVMGRNFGKPFRSFHSRVQQLGLSSVFRYSWKGIGYNAYYRLLNSVDFILPLISPDSHPTYFLSKSTSSIAAAVGFTKVPLAHRRLAELYGIADACLTYTADMTDTMRSALEMPAQELERYRERVARVREDFLQQSERQLAMAIEAVTLRSSRPVPLAVGQN